MEWTKAIRSAFRIVDLLAITGAVATYFALRSATVRHESMFFVELSPFVVSLILAIYAASRNLLYKWIYLVALISAIAASTAWAIEMVYRLPGTTFLHKDWVYNNYGVDPLINAIVVITTSCVATALCGSFGAICRFLVGRRLRS